MANAATSTECANLLNRAGGYFYGRGNYGDARPLFERAVAIRQKVLGPRHPDTATSRNNLSLLGKAQDTSAILGLAGLLPEHMKRGHAEHALALAEKNLGPEHVQTGACLSHLATLLRDQGDLAGARPLFERALAICEKALGPEHPDTSAHLSNLARVLRDTGRATEAEPLFGKAIATSERVLGRDHPDTQRYASHYARLLVETGRAAEALTVAQLALATHEAAFGLNHPWTKDSARITADALDALGRTGEAKVLRERYGVTSSDEPKSS